MLALLALAAWAAVQYGPRLVDAVRDKLAKPVLTTPGDLKASSAAPGHPARLVTDGLSNRFWAPAKGKSTGQWVEMTFDQPVRVLEMIVTGGVSPEQDLYLGAGRPADLVVSMWTPADVRTDQRLHLSDHAGPQNFSMAVGDVTRIRVTIESGYDLAQGRVPAIAEIEVFRRP
ncbi:NADase-type glycan-binding domain-containing protein [Actinoplanes sp. NPDC051494]|uniref:NADase-type glycan-binding domain-containing protein n=1 Tax=Actinoplanes sp. NPDC051494 TaxID=3363907 RepID=UPI0037A802F4